MKNKDVFMEGNENIDLRIAIVGMSLRFPGATSASEYWENLCNQTESISFFSSKELAAAGVSADLINNPHYVPARSVLTDLEQFDARFFDMSPNEAALLDPQQRLLLECSWEALESSGSFRDTEKKTCGVYTSVGLPGYLLGNLLGHSELLQFTNGFQVMLGNDKDFSATRISYKLNLRGPSLTVQTGCSSSLVAIHLACQALLQGECDVALAGGSSAYIPQKTGYLYEKGMILSPDGHCRPFAAGAQGTVPGSGAAMVVLKRLDDALRDGDSIEAVVLGSAINNDGGIKAGYTAPSAQGQQAVISEALAVAGAAPESIGYIEAHGTGTLEGDPIEFEALAHVFKNAVRCALGSVKSNFGHLDTASGIAGLIKTVLAVKHGQIPGTLHFDRPNPAIHLERSPFFIPSKTIDWPNRFARRAGVSSFGIGGTNAHLILEEPPTLVSPQDSQPTRKPYTLVLSAKSENALSVYAENLADTIDANPSYHVADIAYSLNSGRRLYEHHQLVVVRDRQDALSQLRLGPSKTINFFHNLPTARGVVFLFPNAIRLYPKIGQDLYRTESSFRKYTDACINAFNEGSVSSDFQRYFGDLSQPSNMGSFQNPVTTTLLVFILQYALSKCFIDWQINPVAMTGNGLGEWVTACLTGHITIKEAMENLSSLPSPIKPLKTSPKRLVELIDPYRIFLEIGSFNTFCPDSKLREQSTFLPAFVSPADGNSPDELNHLSMLLGRLHIEGIQVNWQQVYKNESRKRIWLPPHPLQKERCWIDPIHHSRLHSNTSSPEQTAPIDTKRDIADWFYIPGWRRTQLPNAISSPSGLWVLVENDQASSPSEPDWLSTLKSQFEGDNRVRLISVKGHRHFTELSSSTYGVRFQSMDDWRLLFRTVLVEDDFLQGIIVPEAFRETGFLAKSSDHTSCEAKHNYHSFLRLTTLGQALGALDQSEKIRLVYLTHDLYNVSGTRPCDPLRTLPLGALRVIPQEFGNLLCRSIDTSLAENSTDDSNAIAKIVSEIFSDSTDSIVAYRGSTRWVPSFEPVSFNHSSPYRQQTSQSINLPKTYLITGGLGGIGLTLAKHLAKTPRAKLALLSRSGFPPRKEWKSLSGKPDTRIGRQAAALLEIEKAGGELLILQADVTKQEEMAAAVTKIENSLGPIHGVIHAAGIAGGKVLAGRTEQDLRVLEVKVTGTYILDQVLSHRKLEFMLLCSSLSSWLGGIGQAEYCAANIFLDAFAEYKTSVFSVAWDTWHEVGMAVETNAEISRLRAAELRQFALTPEDGARVFAEVLNLRLPQTIISTRDFTARYQTRDQASTVEIDQLANSPQEKRENSLHPRPNLSIPFVPPRNLLEKELANYWCKNLGFQNIGINDDYFELGGDSLKAIILLSHLKQRLEKNISISALFEAPTISEFASYLGEKYSDITQKFEIEPSQNNSPNTSLQPIQRSSPDTCFPSSAGQQRLWFLHDLIGNSTAYHISTAIRLRGPLNTQALIQCHHDLIRHHDILQTCFKPLQGIPHQWIVKEPVIDIPLIDLSQLSISEQVAETKSQVQECIDKPFDLSQAPLLRALLIRLSEKEHIWVLTLHHIISDEWSINILLREITQLYRASTADDMEPAPFSNGLQYQDYVGWQAALVQSSFYKQQLDYWKKQLIGIPALLQLPYDKPRPVYPTGHGSRITFHWDIELHTKLKTFGRQSNGTLFTVLSAGFAAFLSCYSGSQDLVIGTPIAGRQRPEFESLIGFFVNTLPLRFDLSANPTFHELLRQTRTSFFDAVSNQDVPFEKIVDAVNPVRNVSYSPIFQVMLILRNIETTSLNWPDLQVEPFDFEHTTAMFDLSLLMKETHDGLVGDFIFNTDLFEEKTIYEFILQFGNLLRTWTKTPERRLNELSIPFFPKPKNTVIPVQPPAPDIVPTRNNELPSNEIESLLIRIWQEVLNLDLVKVHDNFFDLGGDSILSLQVISRIREAGYRLIARQLFEHQTIAELAPFVCRLEHQSEKNPSAPSLSLSPGQLTKIAATLKKVDHAQI
jgi:acyl transferase domain-containing protein/acyl carrier protein